MSILVFWGKYLSKWYINKNHVQRYVFVCFTKQHKKQPYSFECISYWQFGLYLTYNAQLIILHAQLHIYRFIVQNKHAYKEFPKWVHEKLLWNYISNSIFKLELHSNKELLNFLKMRLSRVGSESGSSQFHLFSQFHHFTAEPQRLPKELLNFVAKLY
jgi:hypothetical protein